jgi:hypothetical protein
MLVTCLSAFLYHMQEINKLQRIIQYYALIGYMH